MTQKISEEDREKRVQEHMKFAGVSETDARFMVAMALGEIPGDVMEIEEPDPDNETE